jgi:anti-sigma B factor antagonist
MAKLEVVGGVPPLEVVIDHSSDEAVVKLIGELDIATVATLSAALEPLMAERPERVSFDLVGLRFMDSSGLAVLIRTAAVASVRVRQPTAIVRKVIEMTGLTEVLGLDR